jgi:hypothetical protein
MFFSLKGWDSVARGNAPGVGVVVLHPEGVRQARVSQAFSLEKKSLAYRGVAPGYAVPAFQAEGKIAKDQLQNYRPGTGITTFAGSFGENS